MQKKRLCANTCQNNLRGPLPRSRVACSATTAFVFAAGKRKQKNLPTWVRVTESWLGTWWPSNHAYKWRIIWQFRHDLDAKFKCNYGANRKYYIIGHMKKMVYRSWPTYRQIRYTITIKFHKNSYLENKAYFSLS